MSNLKAEIIIRKNISTFSTLSFYTYQGRRISFLGVFDCINAGMFKFSYNLVEIMFYNEVNIIEANAFDGCNRLRRMIFIYPLKSVVKGAFPDISKICFYGEVSSIRTQIKDIHINECKIFFNTCFNKHQQRHSIHTYLLSIIILSLYS